MDASSMPMAIDAFDVVHSDMTIFEVARSFASSIDLYSFIAVMREQDTTTDVCSIALAALRRAIILRSDHPLMRGIRGNKAQLQRFATNARYFSPLVDQHIRTVYARAEPHWPRTADRLAIWAAVLRSMANLVLLMRGECLGPPFPLNVPATHRNGPVGPHLIALAGAVLPLPVTTRFFATLSWCTPPRVSVVQHMVASIQVMAPFVQCIIPSEPVFQTGFNKRVARVMRFVATATCEDTQFISTMNDMHKQGPQATRIQRFPRTLVTLTTSTPVPQGAQLLMDEAADADIGIGPTLTPPPPPSQPPTPVGPVRPSPVSPDTPPIAQAAPLRLVAKRKATDDDDDDDDDDAEMPFKKYKPPVGIRVKQTGVTPKPTPFAATPVPMEVVERKIPSKTQSRTLPPDTIGGKYLLDVEFEKRWILCSTGASPMNLFYDFEEYNPTTAAVHSNRTVQKAMRTIRSVPTNSPAIRWAIERAERDKSSVLRRRHVPTEIYYYAEGYVSGYFVGLDPMKRGPTYRAGRVPVRALFRRVNLEPTIKINWHIAVPGEWAFYEEITAKAFEELQAKKDAEQWKQTSAVPAVTPAVPMTKDPDETDSRE